MEAKRTLIIAEAGVNHNGSLDMAMEMVETAAQAGADFVKFQTFKADNLVTRNAPKAAYQLTRGNPEVSQYDMLHGLELSIEDHKVLVSHCSKVGIGFLSTAFDIESLNLLDTFGLPLFKIPSGEITNLPYIRHVGKFGKPVILSTGMANLGEIEAAMDILEQAGTARKLVTVLHCTSEYPAPFKEVNLTAMVSISTALGVKVGYSDHTLGIEIAIAAVALGASVIEKHFTLDRSMNGPDHAASLEIDEFKNMIRAIRNLEIALGDGVKRRTVSEIRNLAIVRKSIVAARTIKVGEFFSEDNLTVKRPGTGVSPMLFDKVIGKVADRNYEIDDLILL